VSDPVFPNGSGTFVFGSGSEIILGKVSGNGFRDGFPIASAVTPWNCVFVSSFAEIPLNFSADLRKSSEISETKRADFRYFRKISAKKIDCGNFVSAASNQKLSSSSNKKLVIK
jgi:hypothetical protein